MSKVADQHAVYPGREQTMEPLRLGALLEGDVHTATHAAKELAQCPLLAGDNAAGEDTSAVLPHRCRGRCLMDVRGHILGRAFMRAAPGLGPGLGAIMVQPQGRTLKMCSADQLLQRQRGTE